MATYRNGATGEVSLYIMEDEEARYTLAFIRALKRVRPTRFQMECDHSVVQHDGRCAFCKVDYQAWLAHHKKGAGTYDHR